MLAECLMHESALLMRTLLSYVPAEDKEIPPKAMSPPRGGVGVASRPYRPSPLVKEKKEEQEERPKEKEKWCSLGWRGH
jgi:hypothetical protein